MVAFNEFIIDRAEPNSERNFDLTIQWRHTCVQLQSIKFLIYNRNCNQNKSMAQLQKDLPLKVHYFYIRGQCQPVRNLLYHMAVDFEDIMHQKTSNNSIDASFNLGFPMLEDGQATVHDAIVIMNYLCQKYKKTDLLGLTPQNLAKTQEVLIRYSLQKKKIISGIYDMIYYLSIKNQDEKEKAIREKLRKLVGQCRFVDYCLRKINISKGFVGSNLSVIDFLFYEVCFYLHGFFYEILKRHVYFKNFLEFKKHFEKLPFFKKNLHKFEEKYVFFEFDDLEMNKNIEKYWKGSSKCLKQTFKQL